MDKPINRRETHYKPRRRGPGRPMKMHHELAHWQAPPGIPMQPKDLGTGDWVLLSEREAYFNGAYVLGIALTTLLEDRAIRYETKALAEAAAPPGFRPMKMRRQHG